MNTSTSDPMTPSTQLPKNPAKGPLRGQTTLAAKIDKMQILVDNLAPKIDQLPGLRDPFAQLQTMLANAKALRNRLKTLAADNADAMVQRNDLLAESESLFERVQLGLQSVHGPHSERLREFGLKPRGRRTGRPKKKQTPEIPPVEPGKATPAEPAPLPGEPPAALK